MIEWLSGWYNWPFLFSLALGVVFILFEMLFGGLSEVFDLATDFDPDHDVDAGIDGGGHDFFLSGFMWLGMGKVPLTIVFEVLFISFGCIGLLVNALWSEVASDMIVPFSLPVACCVALFGSFVLTHSSATWIARHLPSESTISRPAGGWIGEPGTVVNTVTQYSGQVRIEGGGNVPDVVISAKVHDTHPDPIQRGSQVVVMDYVESTNSYTVIPMEIS